jgi:hypothetical protein
METTNLSDQLLSYFFAIVVVLGILWFVLVPRCDFIVHVGRRGRVRYRGKFPLAHQSEFSSFLTDEMALNRRFTIVGQLNGRRWRFAFFGFLSAAEKQRMRNFLATRL